MSFTMISARTKAVTKCCILRTGVNIWGEIAIRERFVLFQILSLINNEHKFDPFLVRLLDLIVEKRSHQEIFTLPPNSYCGFNDESKYFLVC